MYLFIYKRSTTLWLYSRLLFYFTAVNRVYAIFWYASFYAGFCGGVWILKNWDEEALGNRLYFIGDSVYLD